MERNIKLITTIVVIIIVVAACASAAYVLTRDGGDERIDTDEMAAVYGNANNDYAVDGLDVEFIQSIVDGETQWDADANPFADTNCDGRIDQSDVDLVNKIINDEECDVYYYNYFGEAQQVSYPLTDRKIAVTYWQQAEEMAILGQWDNVVCANASVETRGNIYDLSGVVFMGDSSGSALDAAQVETMLDNGVNLIIGSAYDTVRTYADPLKDRGVDTVYLWHAGDYCISTILTLGVLMDSEEKAEQFLQYWVDIQHTLDERLPAKEDRPTAVIVMMHQDEDRYIGSYGGIFTSVNEPAGEWILIGELANVFTADVTGSTTLGRNYYSLEWFLEPENQFDYMVVMGSGVNAGTQEDYDTWFEGMADKYYSQTSEYQNGNILGVTYSFGGFSGYSLIMVLAWMMYPDLFTQEEAMDWMNYYYENFTDLGADCEIPPQFYLGDGYDASYL